jgi:small subunit ribosomal protein S6
MRHYEIVYIINPNMSDDENRDIIQKFNSLMEGRNAVIIKTQEWGKQRLAYSVQKFYYGFYVLVDFCADSGVTAELERNLKLDDRILKYQTVKLADKADPEELILKEKEAGKESLQEENQDVEEQPAVQEEEIKEEESEVKNGEK